MLSAEVAIAMLECGRPRNVSSAVIRNDYGVGYPFTLFPDEKKTKTFPMSESKQNQTMSSAISFVVTTQNHSFFLFVTMTYEPQSSQTYLCNRRVR